MNNLNAEEFIERYTKKERAPERQVALLEAILSAQSSIVTLLKRIADNTEKGSSTQE